MNIEIAKMSNPTANSLRCDSCGELHPTHRIIVNLKHSSTLIDLCDNDFDDFTNTVAKGAQ